MQKEHEIRSKVYAAKEDMIKAELIEAYIPFIRALPKRFPNCYRTG